MSRQALGSVKSTATVGAQVTMIGVFSEQLTMTSPQMLNIIRFLDELSVTQLTRYGLVCVGVGIRFVDFLMCFQTTFLAEL